MAVLTDSSTAEILPRDDYVAGGTLGALNAEAVLQVHGSNQVLVDLRTAALTGTLSFEGTVDNVNYFAIPAFRLDTTQAALAVVAAGALSVACVLPTGGWRAVRVRVSAYTSGNIAVVMRASIGAGLGLPTEKPPHPASLHVTVTAAVNAGATLTLPAVAGMRHYVTKLKICRLYSVVGIAAAAPNNVTSTNLAGAPIWAFGQAASPQGTLDRVIDDCALPLQSTTPNTATTFVAPAQLQTIWRLSAWYFLGP